MTHKLNRILRFVNYIEIDKQPHYFFTDEQCNSVFVSCADYPELREKLEGISKIECECKILAHVKVETTTNGQYIKGTTVELLTYKVYGIVKEGGEE